MLKAQSVTVTLFAALALVLVLTVSPAPAAVAPPEPQPTVLAMSLPDTGHTAATDAPLADVPVPESTVEPTPEPTPEPTLPPVPTAVRTVAPVRAPAPPPPDPVVRAASYSGSIEAAIAATFPESPGTALRVATCESRLNPLATGSAGERGLLQIHPTHAGPGGVIARLGYSWAQMYEVGPNLAVARVLYDAGGWRPWSCA